MRKSLRLNTTRSTEVLTKQSFFTHVQELRSRLLWCVGAVVLGSILGYLLRKLLLGWLLFPLKGPLFYTSPVGGFDFVLKVSIFFGFLVSLPVLVYHTLRFIEPVLPKHSKYLIFRYLLLSLGLMLIGILFAYYISLPAALHFLGEFGSDQVKSLISTNEYLSFVTHYMVGFGILFQLPLVLLVINRFTRLTIKTLFKFQRYVIVISFVLAAVITPTPDFVNQIIMAIPLILLYYGSILVIFFMNRKKS